MSSQNLFRVEPRSRLLRREVSAVRPKPLELQLEDLLSFSVQCDMLFSVSIGSCWHIPFGQILEPTTRIRHLQASNIDECSGDVLKSSLDVVSVFVGKW